MAFQLLPLLLTAASTAAQQVNQNRADSERRRATDDAARRNDILRRSADQRVNEEIQKVAGSNVDDARAETQAQFMDALRRSKMNDSPDLGGGGERFTNDLSESGAAQVAENASTADNLARIDAPILQRQREAVGFTNLGTDLSLLGRRAAGEDFLAQLRQSLIRPNPGVDAAANFGNAYAEGLAGRAQKTPKARVSPTQTLGMP